MEFRWTRDPDERPGDDEKALVCLWHDPQPESVALADGHTMTRFVGYRLKIETADGRRLVAVVPRSGSEYDAPLVPSDAPADLRELLNRAWRARQEPGRPTEEGDRLAEIIDTARNLGPEAATKRKVAAVLGRVNRWTTQPTSDYNRDVKAAGGWKAIRREAGL